MAEEHNERNKSGPGPIRAEDVNFVTEAGPKESPTSLPRSQLKLTKSLKVINEMQDSGVIGRYAIGGAVGATFYLEPVATMDVDVFVTMHPDKGGLITTPKPIYDYLTARGYSSVGESLKVEDWLVQFLPPTSPLVEEGIARARQVDIEGVPTFVFTAEHLVAIALQTGRAKDKARIIQFVDAQVLNEQILEEILTRHGLIEKWTDFKKRFLSGS